MMLGAPLRALLVDDERLARSRLRRLLAAHADLVVIAEAGTVAEAVAAIRTHKPDVVFLDVHMPGPSGFALFDRCSVEARVVFVTAFDEYAVRAFEVNALDYLVKPVGAERLARCVARLHELPATTPRHFSDGDRACIETGRGMRFVALDDIFVIRSAGDYTELHLRDGSSPLCRTSMTQWEERLPEGSFLRVHRSAIVQLEMVEEFERQRGGAMLRVRGLDDEVPVSRRAAATVEAALRRRTET